MPFNLLEKAVCFAVQAHAGQTRKDGTPFILHPLEDAAIVSTLTDELEVLAAAVLHDTVEDTDVTPAQILEAFGPRVHTLVMHETENKRPEIPAADSWLVRKQESLRCLEESQDVAVKMLWLGDKLSNMRALHRRFVREGEAVFSAFNNTDPKAQAWYYGTILQLLQPLFETDAYQEYARLYHEIFDQYER